MSNYKFNNVEDKEWYDCKRKDPIFISFLSNPESRKSKDPEEMTSDESDKDESEGFFVQQTSKVFKKLIAKISVHEWYMKTAWVN